MQKELYFIFKANETHMIPRDCHECLWAQTQPLYLQSLQLFASGCLLQLVAKDTCKPLPMTQTAKQYINFIVDCYSNTSRAHTQYSLDTGFIYLFRTRICTLPDTCLSTHQQQHSICRKNYLKQLALTWGFQQLITASYHTKARPRWET